MKTFFKILLIIIIWALIGVAILGGAFFLGYPIKTAFEIFDGLFVAWVAFLILRRLVVRYRAKRRVQQLINSESGSAAGEGDETKTRRMFGKPKTAFDRRFKAVVALLRGSRLRDKGDPLYALPWFLVLGADGTGKTSLLAQSELPSPTIDNQALRSEGDTADWWLYNQGIIVDAPGSYIGDEKNKRNPEAGKLLQLLNKFRPKEPLNGVVVAISLEKLLNADRDELFSEGRAYRKRVDEFMRGLKLQLPVYLLVTRCNALPGFQAWCEALPREALRQPMGWTNVDDESAMPFVRGTLGGLGDRIKELMIPLANTGGVTADLLLLPTQLEGVQSTLESFADGLFQDNSYEEAPIFRGLYFVGQYVTRENGTEKARQAFSQQIFTEILPADRSLRSTLSSAERAELILRRSLLSGWGIAIVALFVVLTSAYLADKGYLTTTARADAGQFVTQSSLAGNIKSLYGLQRMILKLQARVGDWWVPWFGLPGDSDPVFVKKLQHVFDDRVSSDLLKPVNDYFARQVADSFLKDGDGVGGNSRADAVARERLGSYIGTLVRRINILTAYQNDADKADLLELPSPFQSSDLSFDGAVNDASVAHYNRLYIQSLVWSGDEDGVDTRLQTLRRQLVHLLEFSNEDLSWLIPWANSVAGQSAVSLSDFWSGSGRYDDSISVPPAFTLQGKTRIDRFVAELESADPGSTTLARLKAKFDKRYRRDYLDAWARFAEHFGKGMNALVGRREWQSAVDNLATPRNPYFKLLDEMTKQLQPFTGNNVPDWLAMTRFYEQMRAYAPSDQVDNSKRNKILAKLGLKFISKIGPAGKALAKQGKGAMKTQKKLKKASGASGKTPDERAAALQEAAKLLTAYRKALVDESVNSDANSVAYNTALNIFNNPDDPGKGSDPYAQAYGSVQKLQEAIGRKTVYNRAFWAVYSGPLQVIKQYAVNETGCYVQKDWQQNFLTQIDGVPSYKLGSMMFGKKGIFWSFISKDLGPFLALRYGAGYVPTHADGSTVAFEPEFLTFASHAHDGYQTQRDSYPVSIEALPTSANAGAIFQPSKVQLTVQCQAGPETLTNYNFPVRKKIDWTDSCGDTTLKIAIGQVVLKKTYSGPLGFPAFLRDFASGSHRFVPSDFPDFEGDLRDYHVKYIKVAYRMRGAKAVTDSLKTVPLDPPQRIAACWDSAGGGD